MDHTEQETVQIDSFSWVVNTGQQMVSTAKQPTTTHRSIEPMVMNCPVWSVNLDKQRRIVANLG